MFGFGLFEMIWKSSGEFVFWVKDKVRRVLIISFLDYRSNLLIGISALTSVIPVLNLKFVLYADTKEIPLNIEIHFLPSLLTLWGPCYLTSWWKRTFHEPHHGILCLTCSFYLKHPPTPCPHTHTWPCLPGKHWLSIHKQCRSFFLCKYFKGYFLIYNIVLVELIEYFAVIYLISIAPFNCKPYKTGTTS